MTSNAHKALIVAAFGATGSGKSIFIKRLLKQIHSKRLLIWSPMEKKDNYAQFGTPVSSLERDVFPILVNKAAPFRLVYLPQGHMDTWPEQFNSFCEISCHAEQCDLVCEELADVVTNFKVPPWWKQAVRKGRGEGMRIFAASQRPADIDKTFFDQATLIRTGRLNGAGSVKTLANNLMVPEDQVRLLKPLEYIERDMDTGTTRTGKLKI